MWKICLLLSLAGTLQHPVSGGLPNIPWPPTLPADMFLPFLPQIVLPVQATKIELLLLDVHLDGLAMNNSCNFGKTFFVPFKCTNVTLRAGFKAGGGIYNLPIVGKGTISLDLALDVIPINIFGAKLPVVFDTFKFEIDGLNPGSDMKYLVNSLVNSLKQDFEQAIKILGKKLLVTEIATECGAENIESLGEALWDEEVIEKYLNFENEPSETDGKPLETEKTKSSKTEASLNLENTLRCVEGVIAAKLEELVTRHPGNQLLTLSKTLGDGLAALFTLYMPN